MNDEEQAATETDTPPVDGAEVESGEQDDLDQLLAEFDSKDEVETPQPEQKTEPDDVSSLKETVEYLKEVQFQNELRDMISTVKGADDKLGGLPDKLVRGWLEAEIRDDTAKMRAFTNRSSNPGAFNRVLKKMGEGFAKELNMQPDSQLTQDRDAVRSAVRGTSSTQPETDSIPPQADLNKMSDAELRRLASGR